MNRLAQIRHKLNALREEADNQKIDFVEFLASIVFKHSYVLDDDTWEELNNCLLLQEQMFFCLFMTKEEIIRFIDIYDKKDQDLCDEENAMLDGTYIINPKPDLKLVKWGKSNE